MKNVALEKYKSEQMKLKQDEMEDSDEDIFSFSWY